MILKLRCPGKEYQFQLEQGRMTSWLVQLQGADLLLLGFHTSSFHGLFCTDLRSCDFLYHPFFGYIIPLMYYPFLESCLLKPWKINLQ